MKIEVNVDSPSKLAYLAEGGFTEILSLPKKRLIGKGNSSYYGSPLHKMAEKANVELLKGLRSFDPECSFSNEIIITLAERVMDYEKDKEVMRSKIQEIAKFVGFDNYHLCRNNQKVTMLHILGDAGDISILNHPEITNSKIENSHWGLPIFNLYRSAEKEDMQKLLKFPAALWDMQVKRKYSLSNYPLYYLTKNKNRPSVKEVREHFRFNMKHLYSRKFCLKTLDRILEEPNALRFILD